ncbi:AraC family transcriptional regulator [Marivirga sp. S37H4]|uniref:AraC family transcriptional regulator n=1 Tax=Marivirga aurantiaca TaxID=2802615 RepID=A0A934WZP9_9BACT|nr:helix-turn-helix domain-containing protein [Marivirga aurantiaca]MBK6266193.1 AraC family transcriptional regulator [Marivirga aurantiaca]
MIQGRVAITIITILSLQAIILSILLFFKNRNKQASALLGLVIFFFGLTAANIAIYFGLSVGGYSELIPYIRLELLYGIGPALYLYTKSITNPEYKIEKTSYLHFLPVLLEFFYYRTSFYREGAIELFESPQNFEHIFFMCQQWIGVISGSMYMLFSVKLLLDYKRWLHNNFSSLQHKSLQWLHAPVITFVSFWCIWFSVRIIDLLIYSGDYAHIYFYPMFILLSILTIWVGFQGYVRSQTGTSGFINNDNLNTYEKNPDINYAGIIHSIKESMEKEKLYLEQDLHLKSLSKRLDIQAKHISKAINQELKMNFHEFVNRYRVEEFIRRISNKTASGLTLLGHAYESGFASKSTFNHIFKKYTKKTPKEYYLLVQKENNNLSEDAISDE